MTRLQANEQIINHIQSYIRTYPDMRFGQALYNMGIATHKLEKEEIQHSEESVEESAFSTYRQYFRDIFFEESIKTLEKLNNNESTK
jgi:hypothetical protein